MSTSSIIVKKAIIEKIYFKDVNHEDYLFKCDILKDGNLSFKIFNTFVYYRINKKNESSDKIKNIINLWKINKVHNNLNFVKILNLFYQFVLIH